MTESNRRLLFMPRPSSVELGPELFELRTAAVPEPAEGQVLIRNLLFSCDPMQVGWLMTTSSFAAQIVPGQPMRAWGAGRVVASRHPDFQEGDRVWGTLAWEDFTLTDGRGVQPLGVVPSDLPLSMSLGVAGLHGITAYLGVVDICGTREGEQVVVSTAAGATGAAAVQIARNLGARVVGIAGAEHKCRFVREVLGAEECVDYKQEDLASRLAQLCPAGVDVYFDNVGGATLDTLLAAMAQQGRIALCGATSQYSGERVVFHNVMQLAARTLSARGFVVFQHRERFAAITEQLHAWCRSGRLHNQEDLVHGLTNAPSALLRLFQGLNLGKQLVVMDGAAQWEPNLTTAVLPA